MIQLILRNKDYENLEELNNEYIDLQWSYARNGGCGNFSFSLPRELYEEGNISGDFNIIINKRNEDTKNMDLIYQGYVEHKNPGMYEINISGHGYSAQLKRIFIQASYAGTEVSLVLKDILDNYIVPNTGITYAAADISTTVFTPDNLDFNDDGLAVVQKLVDLSGGYEWGVDESRNFYFKPESSTVGADFTFIKGKDIEDFDEDIDFSYIINNVIVQGVQSGGTYYSSTYSDPTSIEKYNLRQRLLSNSSISTDDVAEQFANAKMDEYKNPQRKATLDLLKYDGRVEATTPIDLVRVFSRRDTYGNKKYGAGVYCGNVDRQVNRVNYQVTDTGTYRVSLDLGQRPSSLVEQIAQLDYDINQTKSAAL